MSCQLTCPLACRRSRCTSSVSSCLQFAAKQLNAVGDDVYKGDLNGVPQWGTEIHQAEFKSQLLGSSPLGCFVNRYTPHGGDESTVRRRRAIAAQLAPFTVCSCW